MTTSEAVPTPVAVAALADPAATDSGSLEHRQLKAVCTQFMHGDGAECTSAVAMIASSAAAGISCCKTILREVGTQLVTSLVDVEAGDPARVLSSLLALQRLSTHLPMEVSDLGIAPPLVSLLGSKALPSSATVCRRAVECAKVLCAYEESAKSLLEAGVAPALARLAVRERESEEGDANAMLWPCMALARLAESRGTRRKLAEALIASEVHVELLALAAPLMPDAPEASGVRNTTCWRHWWRSEYRRVQGDA